MKRLLRARVLIKVGDQWSKTAFKTSHCLLSRVWVPPPDGPLQGTVAYETVDSCLWKKLIESHDVNFNCGGSI